jgi:DNA-binding MarR family transcriptional regulator
MTESSLIPPNGSRERTDGAPAGDLQQEIKQTRPFRSLEAEVFVNLLRTSVVLVDEMAEALRPYEITRPQYNVLRILRGAGNEGLASGEVGERLVGREPDVTRLLDRMEARGLVARQRGPVDRRVVTARLTEVGLRLVDALDGPIEALHSRQLGHLSRDELRSLSTLLERARHREP